MLYHPKEPVQYPHEMKEGYQDPGQSGLLFKNVTLQTEDGVQIWGWFLYGSGSENFQTSTYAPKYSDDERPTLVFFHENAGNLGLRIP